MIDAFQRWIDPLVQSVRFADLLDVMLVAAFLFALLSWFRKDARRGAARRFIAALVLFAGVYLLANAFSMYLVKQLLQVLFVVFLVATVVIFQSEIRRMLDRIGTWSFSRRTVVQSRSDKLMDDLTESAAHLAEARMGALIAIRGSENWDSQLQGGVKLNGRVSLPLLYSIFHDKTPGHDGAVLLEDNYITKFAVHLPLASHMPASSKYGGTRHAAAMGLAEQTDALVIVVSEERGVISVAEAGNMVELDTPGDLKARLRTFWATHYDSDSAVRPHWWSRRSLQTGLMALALSCAFWLIFAYRPGTTYRSFMVPIEYRNVGEQWALDGTDETEARVSLSGSERALRILSPSELTASFNLENLQPGRNEFVLTKENLDLPGDVDLYQANPRTVSVTAHHLQVKRLPVQVSTSGSLPDSLHLVSVSLKPASVKVLIPENSSDAPKRIDTEELDMSGMRKSQAVTLKLIPPDGTRLPEGASGKVKAQVLVQRKQKAPPSESQ